MKTIKRSFHNRIILTIITLMMLVVGCLLTLSSCQFFTSNDNAYGVIEQELTTEEFNNLSIDEQIKKTDELLHDLAQSGIIENNYEYNSNQKMFSYTNIDGTLGGIDLSEYNPNINGSLPDNLISNSKSALSSGELLQNANNLQTASLFNSDKAYGDEAKKKMHIMFAFEEDRKDVYLQVEEEWRKMGLDTSVDYDVTVEDLTQLAGYDATMFSMHGSTLYGRPILKLREEATEEKLNKYSDAFTFQDIATVFSKKEEKSCISVLPEFFSRVYNNNELANMCILSESCRFLGADDTVGPGNVDKSFPNNFEHAGAVCVFGFHNTVANTYSQKMNIGMVDEMIEKNVSIGEAFNTCKQKYGADDSAPEYYYDGKDCTATPHLLGNNEFSLGDVEKGKEQAKVKKAANLYIDYINKNFKNNSKNVYCIVDLNGDNIPEIYVLGPDVASGDHVLTCDGNAVSEISCLDTIAMSNCGTLYYYKGQNHFCLSGGRMGHYQDVIYSIDNGKFVKNHIGDKKEEQANSVNLTYTYDGKKLDEQAYNDTLNKDFDISSAANVMDQMKSVADGKYAYHYEGQNVYYYDGIIAYLKGLS